MIRFTLPLLSGVWLAASCLTAKAETAFPWPVVAEPDVYPHAQAITGSANDGTHRHFTTGAIDPEPNPIVDAVRQVIARDPMGTTDEGTADDAALEAFYQSRSGDLLWVDDAGLNGPAKAVISELQNAGAWGLDPDAFTLPEFDATGTPMTAAEQANVEIVLTRAVLLYARHARGGRISDPTKLLNSHLNRMPQLLSPNEILDGLAKSTDQARYLTMLHPAHDQFQRLRYAYLSVRRPRPARISVKPDERIQLGQRDKRVVRLRQRLGVRTPVNDNEADLFDHNLQSAVETFQVQNAITPADGSFDYDTARALNKRAKSPADKLAANMEMWRWMWEDLGDIHVMANVPEFMLTLKKNGETLYRERVVVGQTSKQTSIFTRTLKHVVLRPMWRVPESIKVRELWPSLRRGGGLMRQYGLQVETKDGQPVNWRRIDWFKNDIRDYEVVQPPGRNSTMGKVKFSFPSQHTIFIHDTPDKYMFRSRRRTFSHGCLRLQNPVKLAQIILKEEKGWTAQHVNELIASGPNRNAIKIETRIPMHLVYFTAWVDDDGKLQTFSDIYGHEKRVRQALAGKWTRIAKGRNHLLPPQPIARGAQSASRAAQRRKRGTRPSDYINRAISGGFF